jgi:hypothetical protein
MTTSGWFLLLITGLVAGATAIIAVLTFLVGTPRGDDELLFEERARRQDRRRTLLRRLGLLRRRKRPGPGI